MPDDLPPMPPLPGLLAEVAEVLGPWEAQRLAALWPQCGRRSWRRMAYIPGTRVDPESRLVQILGPDKAARMCEEFGNMILELPVNAAGLTAFRRREVARRLRAGHSPKRIARDTGLRLDHVRGIVAWLKAQRASGRK
ncbi:hypothetical protein ACN9JG_04050 [Cereibacter azotoformans]|uniref:hypothetical protein n=1 Tax=Cereibacter azotoformans TaxID=43057 RepID=UPI003B21639C